MKIFQFKCILTAIIILFTFSVFAGEGMWLPLLLKQMNESEMKRMGMKMNAEDIYSVNKGSLKDAIVHFGGGCTAEVISSQGLLLTNHHCGYGQIQRHSTLENNYLENGFWALSKQDELPNPDLTATFIIRIEDVTSKIMKGINAKTKALDKEKMIKANIEALTSSTSKKSYEEVFIRSFFHGNQYFLFVTETYRDVRLVGTPPSSIGKFGADTDNWEWPRHTGDFALFRIYANKNNEPATYSPDNVPLKPRHFLPVSMDGVSEGDFTLVFGFPGRTDQYQPSYGVQMLLDSLNPAKIEIRRQVLAAMDSEMRRDPQTKIDYASKYASISNAYKKWIGESQGLERVDGLERKQDYEVEFTRRMMANKKWKAAYSDILPNMHGLYKSFASHARRRDIYAEVLGRNSEYFRFASSVSTLIQLLDSKGEEAFKNRIPQVQNAILNQMQKINPDVENKVLTLLIDYLMQTVSLEFISPDFRNTWMSFGSESDQLVSYWIKNSILTNPDRFKHVMEQSDVQQLVSDLKSDVLFQGYNMLYGYYQEKVTPEMNRLQTDIADLQSRFMDAQMKVMTNKRFYPDANSTLRVTYGRVEGYRPRDGVVYKPHTYLSGIVEKYVPGDYEFDVPKRLLDLSKLKNFGPYADRSGDVPVAFIGSNHTTGGNSGSPAIDAHGNLIGLNFDRVWEGTMSDILYDESICRNIMVDVRYILFIIDKFANAGHLVKEMKLVYPKSGSKVSVEQLQMHEKYEKSVE